MACSGGRDSVALARAANELLAGRTSLPAILTFRQGFAKPPQLVLWHLDHGLRVQSHLDRQFVEQLAERLGVPCISERAELGELHKKHGGNIEELARTERYKRLIALLDNPAQESPVAKPAAAMTAHHLGDQAETVLFNLVRGTHLAGLRGIAPVYKGCIYRPWIKLPPEEIAAYLEHLGQDYCEDPTNLDLALSRNRLRHEVMPALLRINPRAREHLARLAATTRTAKEHIENKLATLEVEQFTERAVDRWLPLTAWPAGEYDAYRLDAGWNDAALLVEYAARCLAERKVRLEANDYAKLADWADEASTGIVVGGYLLALPSPEVFTIGRTEEAPSPRDKVPAARSARLPLELKAGTEAQLGGLNIECTNDTKAQWQRQLQRDLHVWEWIRNWPKALSEMTASPPSKPTWRCFLSEDTKLPLRVRSWNQGDRISLAGGGSKKLGDVFTDAKVPGCFRPVWVVLADANDEPLWVPGLADGAAMSIPHSSEPAYLVIIRESG
ncbi:tRNA lysidine(34) synthetase TilS [bacterium]|nr:tRNA lysidine(34) synthetase TilS [bacterium]